MSILLLAEKCKIEHSSETKNKEKYCFLMKVLLYEKYTLNKKKHIIHLIIFKIHFNSVYNKVIFKVLIMRRLNADLNTSVALGYNLITVYLKF